MGFNLKNFFEELLEMMQDGVDHKEIFEFVEAEKKYAEQCGQLK